MTKHAQKRLQQRGIQKLIVDLILSHGTPERAPGGAIKYHLKRPDVAGLRAAIDKCPNKEIIVDESSGKVITVYHRH